MKSQKYYNGSLILFSILLIILYYIFAFRGFFGFDDIRYARISKLLLDGYIDYTNHNSYRLTVIFPTALSYLLFGINYFSTALPFIIYTVLIIITVIYFVNHKSPLSKAIAVILTLLCNYIIYFSIRIGPDIPMSFFVTLLIYIIYISRFKYKGQRNKLFALIFSIILMMVFITKGVVVLILPYLFMLFIIDVFKKENQKFWLYVSIFLVFFISLYLYYDWWHTGDFLGRINTIAKNSYLNTCSYGYQPLKIVLRRIFYQFFLMMINKEMVVGCLFLIPLLVQNRKINFDLFKKEESFLLVSVVVLWLSANFMSISLVHYNPMCLDPRHYLYLIPITSVAAGFYFEQFLISKKNIFVFISVALLFSIFSLLSNKIQAGFYLLLTIYGLCLILIKQAKYKRQASVILLFAILMVPVFYRIHEANKIDYKAEQQNVTEFLKTLNNKSVIVSDIIQQDYNTFNYGFSIPDSITLLNFKNIDTNINLGEKDFYIIDNKRTQNMYRLSSLELPLFMQYNYMKKQLVFTNNRHLSIYKVDKIFLEPETSPIFESTNFFNGDSIECWNLKPEAFDSIVVYSAPFSEKVIDTSSCFHINLNRFSYCNNLLLKGKVELILYDKTSNYFEILIKDIKGSIKYKESVDIENRIKAYGQGYSFLFQTIIYNELLQEENELQVYLVNQDNKKMYIDDFIIELYELK